MISVDVWKDNYYLHFVFTLNSIIIIDVHSHSNATKLHVPKNSISSLNSLSLSGWVNQWIVGISFWRSNSKPANANICMGIENHDFIIQINIYYHVLDNFIQPEDDGQFPLKTALTFVQRFQQANKFNIHIHIS